MKQSYLSIAASAALALLVMSGCSSSDSAPVTAEATYSGIFVDNGTAGLTYTCNDGVGVAFSGTTDADGKFSGCGVSAQVEFKLGNLTLGKMVRPTNGVFTPRLLAEASTATIEEKTALANNIAATLLSMDSDGDPTNGIQITPEDLEVFNLAVPAGSTASNSASIVASAVQAVVAAAITANPTSTRKVVTPEEAESHLVESQVAIDSGLFDQPEPAIVPVVTGA